MVCCDSKTLELPPLRRHQNSLSAARSCQHLSPIKKGGMMSVAHGLEFSHPCCKDIYIYVCVCIFMCPRRRENPWYWPALLVRKLFVGLAHQTVFLFIELVIIYLCYQILCKICHIMRLKRWTCHFQSRNLHTSLSPIQVPMCRYNWQR